MPNKGPGSKTLVPTLTLVGGGEIPESREIQDTSRLAL